MLLLRTLRKKCPGRFQIGTNLQKQGDNGLQPRSRFVFDFSRSWIESTQELAVNIDIHQRYRQIAKRHTDGDGCFDVQSEEVHVAERAAPAGTDAKVNRI